MTHRRGAHRLQEGQGVGDVVSKVKAGLLGGLAHISKGREVQDRGHIEALQRIGKPPGIGEVGLDQRTPPDGFPMAPDQAVVGDWPVPSTRQGLARMAADIAGAPGYQNGLAHRFVGVPFGCWDGCAHENGRRCPLLPRQG